jgi:choline kinase
MRAIILAAGYGRRLGQKAPKCLLQVGGRSLLERHLRLLRHAGVDDVVIAVGYEPVQIAAEIDRLAWTPRPRYLLNERFELGSVLTAQICAPALLEGGDVLLMDADVLYDQRMLALLTADAHADRLLQDRGFVPGDEPVKLCTRNGRPVELHKRVAEGLEYDAVGESVGFFRFSEGTARRFVDIVQNYVDTDRADQPHEEAVRDLLLERPAAFHTADATGLPWLEIDFPADVARARDQILPQLQALPE